MDSQFLSILKICTQPLPGITDTAGLLKTMMCYDSELIF